VGGSLIEGTTGANIVRQVGLRTGFPVTVPVVTMNRFSSTGLQTIATASQQVRTGQSSTVVAGGLESISLVQNEHANQFMAVDWWLTEHKPEIFMSMLAPSTGTPVTGRDGQRLAPHTTTEQRGWPAASSSAGMEAGIAAAADHANLRTRQRALEAGPRSCSCSESPMSHSIGGHSPTKRARRSALPRSSWSTVFARIHSVMQRPMPASDARCRCQLRGPAWWRIFVNMLHGYPAVAIGARLRGSLGSTA
jgi:hypothetical protein